MYRRQAFAEVGLQYWLWHWARLGAAHAKEADLEYMICVYECGCKGLGEDRQVCTVLLGRVFSAIMAQGCVRVVDLSVAGVQWCIQRPSIMQG